MIKEEFYLLILKDTSCCEKNVQNYLLITPVTNFVLELCCFFGHGQIIP